MTIRRAARVPGLRSAPSGLRFPPATLLHARFIRRELVDRAAELAGHHHLAVLDHIGAVAGCEACEHRGDGVARARALRAQPQRREKGAAPALGRRPTKTRRPRRRDLPNGYPVPYTPP